MEVYENVKYHRYHEGKVCNLVRVEMKGGRKHGEARGNGLAGNAKRGSVMKEEIVIV